MNIRVEFNLLKPQNHPFFAYSHVLCIKYWPELNNDRDVSRVNLSRLEHSALTKDAAYTTKNAALHYSCVHLRLQARALSNTYTDTQYI